MPTTSPQAELPPGKVQWEATVAYSDGTLARRRFWLLEGECEPAAISWACECWTLAGYDRAARTHSPTLKVARVADEADRIAA